MSPIIDPAAFPVVSGLCNRSFPLTSENTLRHIWTRYCCCNNQKVGYTSCVKILCDQCYHQLSLLKMNESVISYCISVLCTPCSHVRPEDRSFLGQVVRNTLTYISSGHTWASRDSPLAQLIKEVDLCLFLSVIRGIDSQQNQSLTSPPTAKVIIV